MEESYPIDKRELAGVCLFTLLAFLPFMGKAFHIDEPLFLAPARQILKAPARPLDFEFNWYGKAEPMADINNTPPLTLYLLAAGLKVTGGGEWAMRLFFIPFDLAAAAGLYLLAARFLRHPFLPVLLMLAAPAYLINLNHLFPEKFAAAFGFWSLYGLVRGTEGSKRWLWASAGLLALSLLSKYMAILFVPPAAAYALHRRVPLSRVGVWLGVALMPLAVFLIADLAGGAPALRAAGITSLWGAASPWSRWPHKFRSFFAFLGGGGLVTAVWPFLVFKSRKTYGIVAGCAVGFLFSPIFDHGFVRVVDRLLGMALALGPVWALGHLFSSGVRKQKGWSLCAAWIISAGALQLFLYWAIVARLVVFMVPPLVILMAGALEGRLRSRGRKLLYLASLGGVLLLSLTLAWVDHKYAGAQRDFAQRAGWGLRSEGRRLFFTGHWGLQYYLERQGAEGLDETQGGWGRVGPGDAVLMGLVNSNLILPDDLASRRVRRLRIENVIPLRLMSGWTGQAGFYSNALGFLPFSISAEPLEEFLIIDRGEG